MNPDYINQKSLSRGQGLVNCVLQIVSTSYPRECGQQFMAGDLTCQNSFDLQLRDSAGLSPASPLSPSIRGYRHHELFGYL